MSTKKIPLIPPLPSGPGVTITADTIEIDLSDTAVLGSIGPHIAKELEQAIRNTRAQPKPSTLAKRSGRLFNVTGAFLASIAGAIKDGTYEIGARMNPSIRGWLFRRISAARPMNIMKKAQKAWAKAFQKKVIIKGKISQTGKVEK